MRSCNSVSKFSRGHIDLARKEAAVDIALHEKPGALALAQTQYPHGVFEKFVFRYLEQFVARILFQNRDQRLSHVAVWIEPCARHHIFHFRRRRGMSVGFEL